MDRWSFEEKILSGLNAGFQKMNEGFQKGARWAGKKAAGLGKKLGESERFNKVKQKTFDFTAENVEKLRNLKINGVTLEEYMFKAGEAGGRFTERQFLRVVALLQKIQPNFKWDFISSGEEEIPLLKAFRTLGVPCSADWDEVRKAYRDLMRANHPDRHAGDPEAERAATVRTQEITEAYEILELHFKGSRNWS